MSENRLNCQDAINKLASKSKYLATLANCFSFIPDNNIPTACVEFMMRAGNPLRLKFNQEFWSKLNTQERAAVIAHEMLHIVLNHGYRMNGTSTDSDLKLQNIAMDMCVNEILRTEFNIDPSYAPVFNNAVYAEKIDDSFDHGRCYEYYYRMIKQSPNKTSSFTSIDEHDWMSTLHKLHDLPSSEIKKLMEAFKKAGMNESEIKKFLQNMRHKYSLPGTEAGGMEKILNGSEESTKRNAKWHKVVRKIRKVFEEQSTEEESWFEQPRRRDFYADYIIPSQESKVEKNRKRNVHIFMDTSGSCSMWTEVFMGSSTAFPKNNYNVHLYCFDTQVYEVNKNSLKGLGYGGTSFKALSDYVNSKIKSYDCIIVLTDGWGNDAKYKKPSLWHWVLTDNCKEYIPKGSKIYSLSDITSFA